MSKLNNLKFGDIVVATARFRPFIGLLLAILMVAVVLPLKPRASGASGSSGRILADEAQQDEVVATADTSESVVENPGALPDQFSASFTPTDYSSTDFSDDESFSASEEAEESEESEEEEEPEEEPEPEPSPIACVPGVACVTPSE